MFKKLTAILLSILCVACLFCGCGEKEENKFLPYGLEFGMSYDETVEIHSEMPELEDATANDGYFCGNEFNDEAYIELFELSDGDPFVESYATASFAYSFNEDKELYECYTITTINDNEKGANHIIQLVDFFNEKTGIESEFKDGAARWETDDNKIEVLGTITDDGIRIVTIVHNKNYELS